MTEKLLQPLFEVSNWRLKEGRGGRRGWATDELTDFC